MYVLGQIVSCFLFLLASYASFYVPGKYLLQLTKRTFSDIEAFFLSTSLGIVVFIVSNYLFSWLGQPFMPLFLLAAFLIYVLIGKRDVFKVWVHMQDRISVFLIVLGTLSFLATTFFSGWMTHGALQFIGVNGADGIMHLGFIRDEAAHFPPMHISLAGFSLRGYHYFYDFLASRFLLFYHFSVLDLQFRLFPLLLSFLYGLGFYVVSARFTKSAIVKRFIVFTAYFSQGIVFLYAVFDHTLDMTDGFNIAQPVTLITDPSVILSIVLLCAGFFVLTSKKKTISLALLTALFFGILAEVKVYTGILGIIGLSVYSFYGLLREKAQRGWYIQVLVLTALLTAATYFPNNLGVGGLLFAPLLIYQQFIREGMFNWMHWDLTYHVYLLHHNIPRIIQMNLVALLIFWIGNLGLRAVVLLKIPRLFQKTFWRKGENIFLLSVLVPAILIPSLFIQSYSVFNIQQFLWLFIILLSIPVGITLGGIFERYGKTGRVLLFAIVFGLTVVGYTNREVMSLFPQDVTTISQTDRAIFATLQKTIPQRAYLVVLPEVTWDAQGRIHYSWKSFPYVAAMSGHATYVEDEDLAFHPVLEVIAEKRRQQVYALTNAFLSCDSAKAEKVLSGIGSSYVVSFDAYPCMATSSAVLRTLSSENLHFYQLKLE